MKKLFLLSLILLPLLGTFSTPKPAEAASCSDARIQMSGNVRVKRGRGWTVCNGKYRLSFQSDGNLVLYNSSREPIWATGTDGSNADVLAVQSDGNVVLYGQGRALWATNTHRTGSVLAIQTDGNIVVYNRNRQPVFYTSTDMGQRRTFSAAAEWQGSSPAPAPARSNANPVAPVPGMSIINGCSFGDYGPGCTSAVTNTESKHVGKDYLNDPGTSVRAICDGVVERAGYESDVFQRYTLIRHNCAGQTMYAYYGHIDPSVGEGKEVTRGQTIGVVSDPQGKMDAHLHFGLADRKQKLDRDKGLGWGYSVDKSGWINPQF